MQDLRQAAASSAPDLEALRRLQAPQVVKCHDELIWKQSNLPVSTCA